MTQTDTILGTGVNEYNDTVQVTWLASPRSEAQTHVCLPVCGAPWWVLLQHTLLCCDYFSLSRVVSHAFSVVCVFSKFTHHPHPLGYLCAKFCLFRGLHCWASLRRKLAYSTNQSITQPAYMMSREPKRLCFGKNLRDEAQRRNHKSWYPARDVLATCCIGQTNMHIITWACRCMSLCHMQVTLQPSTQER